MIPTLSCPEPLRRAREADFLGERHRSEQVAGFERSRSWHGKALSANGHTLGTIDRGVHGL